MIEVLISLAILTVAAAGLLQLHGSVIRGVARSDHVAIALDIAHQRAEELRAAGFDNLPDCASSGVVSCRLDTAEFAEPPTSVSSNPVCSRWVDYADVPQADGAAQPEGTRFRVDVVSETHPDSWQPDSRVVTVSVCWREINQDIRMIQTRRMLVPGV